MRSRGPAFPREALAGLAVLAANLVIMAVEMLATRLLFPRFGNTVFTWSAIITIIIAGLFLGYMAGGIAAERSRDRWRLVGGELAASGLLVLAIPWLSDLLLGVGRPSVFPPLLGCFLVFGLPAACLAAVPPAAVGILVEEGRGPSLSAGLVSALSALGSIAGTLGATFVLIPAFGVRSLFVACGACLGVLSLAVLWAGQGRGRALGVLTLYALALPWAARASARPAPTTLVEPIFSRDSAYQLVRVFEHGSGEGLTRLLMLDSTQEGAMKIKTKEPVFAYTRAYRLFINAFGKAKGVRILHIGGGAYAMPVRTAEAMPRATVEVAELDPVVREAAERYFRASEPPNLRTILQDGRQALRGRENAYDGIFIDAYQGVYAIPFHLATREFFREVSRSLRPDGIAALNLIGEATEREGLLCSVTRTLESVFPRVELYPVHGFSKGAQNVIILAGKRQDPLADLMKGTGFPPGRAAGELSCAPGKPLTDDFAPVEWLVSRYLKP